MFEDGEANVRVAQEISGAGFKEALRRMKYGSMEVFE